MVLELFEISLIQLNPHSTIHHKSWSRHSYCPNIKMEPLWRYK